MNSKVFTIQSCKSSVKK